MARLPHRLCHSLCWGREELCPSPLAAKLMPWWGSKLKTSFPCLDVMALPMWWHSSPSWLQEYLPAIELFIHHLCPGLCRQHDWVFWGCDSRLLHVLFTPHPPQISPYWVLPFSDSHHITHSSEALKVTPSQDQSLRSFQGSPLRSFL